MSVQFIFDSYCYARKTNLIGVYVVSNLLIAISYFSIFITLIYFLRQRKDLPYASTLVLFGAFVISSGASYLVEIWTLWHSTYWIFNAIKAVIALISCYTAIVIFIVVPHALKFSSLSQLQLANQKLKQEIVERKQIEAELEHKKKFVQIMLDNLSEGIVACDENGVLSLFNQATKEFHGLPQQPIAADCWAEHYDLYYPDARTIMLKDDVPLFRALKGESVRDVEMAIVPKQGKPRNLIASGDPIVDSYGKKLGAIAIMRDVTENRQAQQDLQIKESAIKSFYDSAPLMMGIVKLVDGKDLCHVSGNSMAAAAFSLNPETLVGKRLSELNIPQKLKQQLLNACLQSKAKSQPIELEFSLMQGNRQNLCLIVSMVAQETSIEDPIFSYILQDISDRKAAEVQLNKSLQEKEVMLQEIHHRVKNNLQVICSLLNLQSRYITEEKTLEAFKETRNRVRAIALVHEQLYQSHSLWQISLSDYITQLTTNLFRAYAVNSNIKYSLEIEEFNLDLDTAVSCGSIVNEVVSNAFKYAFDSSDRGKISIKAYANHHNSLVLLVEDNGKGLEPDFDLKSSQTLGLRLVKNLTQQLAGELDITTQPNLGTKFKFIFHQIKSNIKSDESEYCNCRR